MKLIVSIVISLLLATVVLFISWLSFNQNGLQWLYQQASPHLPSTLKIDNINGRLIGPITLSGVSYEQDDGSRYTTDELELDWNPVALLTAKLDVQSLDIKNLNLVLAGKAPATEPAKMEAIELPLQYIRVRELNIDSLRLQQGNEAYQLSKLELNASMFVDELTIKHLRFQGEEYKAELQGSLQLNENYRHHLNFNWSHKLADGKELLGQGKLQGNALKSKLEHQIQGALQMKVQAQLTNLLQDLSWQAELDVKKFDSQALDASWPDLKAEVIASSHGNLQHISLKGQMSGSNTELGPFQASFDVQRDDDSQIKINRLRLNPKNSQTQLVAQGSWTPDQTYGVLDLRLDWQHLKWPQTGTPWFNTSSGQGALNGTLDQYHFTLQTERPWPEIPASSWKVSGQGDLQGLKLSEIDIKTLQGKISGQARLDWGSRLKWDAQINMADIQPEAAWPEWPGKLAGRFNTSGRYHQDVLSLQTDVLELKGQLRDFPVSAAGRIDWTGDRIELKNVRASSAQSVVSVNGSYDKKLAMDWSIDSPNLDQLYPHIAGSLTATGKISGTLEQPVILAKLQAKNASFQGYRAQQVKGSIELEWMKWIQAKASLNAEQISVGNLQLDSLEIESSNDKVSIQLKSKQLSSRLNLKGQMRGDSWYGELVKAELETERFSSWQLQSATKLKVSQTDLTIDRFCLQDKNRATVCSELSQKHETFRSKLELNQVPLALFKPWLPVDFNINGTVQGRADLNWSAQHALKGELKLELPGGLIQYPLEESEIESWPYREGRVNISLTDTGITATSRLFLNKNDRVEMDVKLPSAHILQLKASQQIQGNARMNIKDIRWLQAFIPEVQQMDGSVDINLQAKGSLDKPELQAFIEVEQAHFMIPRLGLNIHDVKLQGHTDGFNQLNFDMSANSGAGNIKVNGTANLQDGKNWSTRLNITGENFEVSKIPEARVNVSPQLKISLKPNVINVSGSMYVPYARLSPKDLSSAAQVSNDVVIVGQEQPPEKRWAITTSVRVTLDPKHVLFTGFGFDGRIGGSLLLEESPGQITRASGEVRVSKGHYRAYGQRLVIENGRLLFTGGPLMNPGLDFRAVRVVNEVTAGLKVSGSFSKPKLEVFSIPAMGQTDALSYIVLGRPMESSSSEDGDLLAKAALALGLSGGDSLARMLGDRFGLDEMRVERSDSGDQASLVVGRYLSPRLYVSYGVGLIESINTFSLRYQLSSKWQLKAESGEAESGDLLYTIER